MQRTTQRKASNSGWQCRRDLLFVYLLVLLVLVLLVFLWVPNARQLPSAYMPGFSTNKWIQSRKILCFVPTVWPLPAVAYAVLDTWAPLCDRFVFTSRESSPEFHTVKVHSLTSENKNKMFNQSKAAWGYVHDNFLNEFDFFIKADTDTYLYLANMREWLADEDPEAPIYTGKVLGHLQDRHNITYIAGGCIILSRAAMRKVGPTLPQCDPPTMLDDRGIGECLVNVGVYARRSLTNDNKQRFHLYDPAKMMNRKGYPKWYWKGSPDVLKDGIEHLGRPVMQHFVKDFKDMYAMHFSVNNGPFKTKYFELAEAEKDREKQAEKDHKKHHKRGGGRRGGSGAGGEGRGLLAERPAGHNSKWNYKGWPEISGAGSSRPRDGGSWSIVFLKTRKTGSCTVQNILSRFALRNKLTVAVPLTSNFLWPKFKPFDKNLLACQAEPEGFNMLMHHMQWSTKVDEVMAASPFYITILRDPISCYLSNLAYNAHNEEELLGWYEKPPSRKREVLVNTLDPSFVGVQDHGRLNGLVESLRKRIGFAMLTERFDESLVLLAHQLGWDPLDMVYLKQNEIKYTTVRPQPTAEQKKAMMAEIQGDTAVYQAFKEDFERHVEEFGRERLAKEVKKLRSANEQLKESCIEDYHVKSNEKRNKFHPYWASNRLWRPYVYKLRKEASTNSTCFWSAIPELRILEYLRARQENERGSADPSCKFNYTTVVSRRLKKKKKKVKNQP